MGQGGGGGGIPGFSKGWDASEKKGEAAMPCGWREKGELKGYIGVCVCAPHCCRELHDMSPHHRHPRPDLTHPSLASSPSHRFIPADLI